MKKSLLILVFALFATNGLWAQSDKVRRLQESEQAYRLYERYKQNQTLSKEEYNLLSPYLSAFEQGDLTTEQAQNRTIGGGTPQTNLVSTAYNFSQAVGTYTPITGGTVLGSGTGVDDNNYPSQAIGFTFNYDGVDYTELGVNSNGFIWFGTTAPATNTYIPISSTGAAGSRIIAALGGDLQGLVSPSPVGELRIQTIGVSPNRICIVQWSNFQHYRFTPVTGDDYNFQIHLREADGRIEIHYGTFGKDAMNRAYQVGLRGTANTDFNNRRIEWNNSANGTANNQTLPLTTTLLPQNGLIYKFVPTTTSTPEVDVTNIYTLGKVGIPLGNPVPLSVRVRNLSANPVTADVTVTIKNTSDVVRYTDTQTGVNLAPNSAQTLTFTGWSPTITETDSIVAEITQTSGIETDLSNNRIVFVQQVNNNTFSYSQQGQATVGGVGFTGATGDFVARFTANPSGNINQVGVNFTSTGVSYRIGIWDDDGPGGVPGTLLWESGSLTTTPGLNTIPVSPAQNVSGGYYVGVRQIVTTNVGFAYQSEAPIRSNNFYFVSPSGGTTWTDFAPANPFRFMVEPRFELPNDVGVTGVTAPVNGGIIPAGIPTNISATVFNYGTAAQTPDVFYNINGGTPVGPVSAGLMPGGASQTVTFSGTNAFSPPAPGTYTIRVFTAHPGDGDASNDTTTITVTASPLVTVTNTTPYFENFEASAGGWISRVVSGTVNDWVRGTPAKVNINSAFSGTQAWVTGTTAPYQNNQNSAVISPIFDLSSLTIDPIVSFNAFMHITDTSWDAGVLEYSTNSGITWTKLGVLQADETDPEALNWYNNSSTFGPVAPPKWSRVDAGYQLVRKTLVGLAGQSSVLIRLRFGTDGSVNGQGWAFDDFRISPIFGPEIGVTGNTNPISSGSTTPSLANHTDFGFVNTTAARPSPNVYPVPMAEIGPLEKNVPSASVEASNGESVARMSVKPTETPIANALPGTVVRTFTITNTGFDSLTISGVTITGADAAEFSVTASPASTVAVSGSTTFQITFNPSTDGVKNATVEIANDDADENPYTFAIRGTGITSLPLPYAASLNGTAPGWTTQVVTSVGTTAIFGLVGTGVTLPDGSSGGAIRANFFGASAGRVEVLRTPFISLSGATNPVLNFDVAYRSYTGSQNDRIEVVVSTDGGATYQVGSPVLYNKSRTSTPSLATLANSATVFTPTASSQWRHETVDLSQFAGQTDLLIGFRATSAFGNNAWIANVTIQDVSSLAISNVTGNAAFTQLGITINFSNFGGSGGNLYFSRFNNAPTSDAATEYAVNTTATTQDSSIFTPNVTAPRWWTITYDGQTLDSTIDYSVSIDITGIPGVNNPDRLYILRRPNRFGSWVALPTTRSGSILTATGLTGFSDFVVGGDELDNPLPVNLGTFTGRNVAQGVELRWTTISETDNAGFDVRRAELIDGVAQDWLTVGTYRSTPSLVGQGTTSQAHSYTYTDVGVQVGKKYLYALRSVDLNGTIHDYPQTVSVEVNTLAPKVYTYKLEQNYPNPFNPSTRIVYQVAATSNVKLEVFDMLGRKVATLVNERKEAGEYPVIFNAKNLSSGVYFYRLQTDKFTQTKKLMLVK